MSLICTPHSKDEAFFTKTHEYMLSVYSTNRNETDRKQ